MYIATRLNGYHGVSSLVRLGVLVPIIDGFDELLGVGGYDDAFSSLTGFIEELDGQGQIVASARSTYYEQEFVSRSSSVSSLGAQAWTQVPRKCCLGRTTSSLRTFTNTLAPAVLSPEENHRSEKRVESVFSGQNAELRRKPLFVARTVDVILEELSFAGGENLLRQLVVAYLERERKDKLLDRQGGTLLTTPQLELLFKTLAEDVESGDA